jgi:archaea-specific DNA-binding protein
MTDEQKQESKEQRPETNEIFVGDKPFMKYVIATLMQLNKEGNNSAIIKARGKFISRGVDIAEVAKKKYKESDNVELKDEIKIGTDEFTNNEGKQVNISTISITLSK